MRKEFYLKNIREAVQTILKAQDAKGSFCVPFQEGIAKVPNARWQEAVLTLAWAQKHLKKNFAKEIEKGIDYWVSIQNSNGSFPEINEESFSATAFSSLAIAHTLKLLKGKIDAGIEEKAIRVLEKSRDYLISHHELERTNQEAAALNALLQMKEFVEVNQKDIETKAKNVLKNKTKSGFFRENGGIDLGYASLTCEMLGQAGYLNECREYFDSLKYFVFPDGTVSANFSRTIGWIILDALEMAKEKNSEAETILNLYIQADRKDLHSARHFLDLRHVMTDAYRLCWAYDNCKKESKKKARLPFKDLDWHRLFPENVLVARKPKYMAVFYITDKFSQGIWFKNGLVSNLAYNIQGNTVIKGRFVAEDLKQVVFSFRNDLLIVNGVCKANYANKPVIVKALLKIIDSIKLPEGFEKSFRFEDGKIRVGVVAGKGVEKVPVLGRITIKPGFAERKLMQKPNMVFFERKDFKVFEKAFENELSYELSE